MKVLQTNLHLIKFGFFLVLELLFLNYLWTCDFLLSLDTDNFIFLFFKTYVERLGFRFKGYFKFWTDSLLFCHDAMISCFELFLNRLLVSGVIKTRFEGRPVLRGNGLG